jgi:hypothetical protein
MATMIFNLFHKIRHQLLVTNLRPGPDCHVGHGGPAARLTRRAAVAGLLVGSSSPSLALGRAGAEPGRARTRSGPASGTAAFRTL